jgi:hypothetical protein
LDGSFEGWFVGGGEGFVEEIEGFWPLRFGQEVSQSPPDACHKVALYFGLLLPQRFENCGRLLARRLRLR